MNFLGFHIHPAVLLLLMAAWGAGGLYLFSAGVCELLQINHEMSEVFTKGNTAVTSDPTPPAQVHIGWRFILGTASLALATSFFRYHYSRRREF